MEKQNKNDDAKGKEETSRAVFTAILSECRLG
jgi:hypothetical protein